EAGTRAAPSSGAACVPRRPPTCPTSAAAGSRISSSTPGMARWAGLTPAARDMPSPTSCAAGARSWNSIFRGSRFLGIAHRAARAPLWQRNKVALAGHGWEAAGFPVGGRLLDAFLAAGDEVPPQVALPER